MFFVSERFLTRLQIINNITEQKEVSKEWINETAECAGLREQMNGGSALRKLIHILYITEKDIELHLRGEALEAKQNKIVISHIPLHNLEGIVSFSYLPATPALMAACAERQIAFSVLNRQGRLQYRIEGRTRGNPELRLRQFQIFSQEEQSLSFARSMISAKIHNSRMMIAKHLQNHQKAQARLHASMEKLIRYQEQVVQCGTPDALRGVEGLAAKTYYDAFTAMNLSQEPEMKFETRSKHPPEEPYNALLSFAYSLLTTQCIAALETVGLDPYYGVFHTIKSGKPALALDMMEELRAPVADRFVMRAVNLGIIRAEHFEEKDRLSRDGLKIFLAEWDKMRNHEVRLADTGEKIPLGLLPHYQAQLMSRVLYEKDDRYHPYQMGYSG